MKRVVMTGNNVMDCLQAAIKFHGDNKIRLRAILLAPEWYGKFFEYMDNAVHKRTGEHIEEGGELGLFGVDIRMGHADQKSEMHYEY